MSIDVAALQELPPTEQAGLAAQPAEFCCFLYTLLSCFGCTITR